MNDNPDEIIGHKTFYSKERGYYHTLLTRGEAEKLLAQCDAAKAKRTLEMPDERSAICHMDDGYERLKALGWKEAIYCPKDGTEFLVIEAGSSGIHHCVYHGDWPTGGWWILEDGDMWPSRPILFKLIETQENIT